jgi:hypothetical protein
MPLILSLQCENHAECHGRIDGDEALDLADAGNDDARLWGGQRIERELYAAAEQAGWVWTGAWWLCHLCAAGKPPEQQEICGLCGEPGADKMALWTGGGIYWPGEEKPETEMVHAECERQETTRAHAALSQSQRDRVIDDATRT